MQGRVRKIDILSVQRPQPHTTNLYRKRRERENSWRQKRREQLGQQKGIGPAVETSQFHNIEYGVNQIVPERYWERNKSNAVLRGSAAGRRISIPMCDQSTACNPDWHIRHRSGLHRRSVAVLCMLYKIWVTPDLVQHTQHCHWSTMGKITVKHAAS